MQSFGPLRTRVGASCRTTPYTLCSGSPRASSLRSPPAPACSNSPRTSATPTWGGILAHGFLPLRCADSGHDTPRFRLQAAWVLPFLRCAAHGGSSPRTASTKASPVYRQTRRSLPIPPRLLRAAQPPLVTPGLHVVHLGLTHFLRRRAGRGPTRPTSRKSSLIERIGSAVNLNIPMYRPVLARCLPAHRGRFGFPGVPADFRWRARQRGQAGGFAADNDPGLVPAVTESSWPATATEVSG